MEPAGVVVLVVSLLCLAINVAGIVVGLRLRRARPASGARPWRKILLGGAIAAVALALAAEMAAVIRAFWPIGAESIDPFQKARILGEAISEAMNLMALALLIGLPVSIAVLIYAAVTRHRDKRSQNAAR